MPGLTRPAPMDTGCSDGPACASNDYKPRFATGSSVAKITTMLQQGAGGNVQAPAGGRVLADQANGRSSSTEDAGRHVPLGLHTYTPDHKPTQDSKSKFTSAKALFEQLERQTIDDKQQAQRMYSPVLTQRKAIPPSARSQREDALDLHHATAVVVGGAASHKPAPPVPPKPRVFTKQRSQSVDVAEQRGSPEPPQIASPLSARTSRTRTRDPPTTLGKASSVQNTTVTELTPDSSDDLSSPLSEVSRQFNELVESIELMSRSPRQISAMPVTSNATVNGGADTSGLYGRSRMYNNYPRLSETLHAENSQNAGETHPDSARSYVGTSVSHSPAAPSSTASVGVTATAAGMKSSLYEPYWRQPWYRKYGASTAMAGTSTSAVNAVPSAYKRSTEFEEPTTTDSTVISGYSSRTQALRYQFLTDNSPTEPVKEVVQQPPISNTFSSSKVSQPTVAVVERSIVTTAETRPVPFRATNHAQTSATSTQLPSSISSGLVKAVMRPAVMESPVSHPPVSSADNEIEPMTKEEASVLLSPSNRKEFLAPHAPSSVKPVVTELSRGADIQVIQATYPTSTEDIRRLSTCSIDSAAEKLLATPVPAAEVGPAEAGDEQRPESSGSIDFHYLPDGHFWVEIAGLGPVEDSPCPTPAPEGVMRFKPPSKVSFCSDPIRVYSTHSVADYDRRNEDVDPVAASAEYELERRVEKMDKHTVDLMKGPEGLGLSIIGMGVGADAGLEKLGIFVKSITSGGAAEKDGRIHVCDQIVEVDGNSLLGVTQAYAAQVLRSTSGLVRFTIGREKDVESSEIAMLIRQSLEQDRMREEQQRQIDQLTNRTPQHLQQQQEATRERHGAVSRPTDWSGKNPTRGSIPSTDSVFDTASEDATPEAFADTEDIQELMQKLRQQPAESKQAEHGPVFLDDDTTATASPSSESASSIEAELSGCSTLAPAFQSGSDQEIKEGSMTFTAENSRMVSQILNESLQEFPPKPSPRGLTQTGAAAVQMARPPHRKSSLELLEMKAELADFRKEMEKYQQLLLESREQYTDLEKKYHKAKKLIKDYQDREKDLVTREEEHLAQLRVKDHEYNNLVRRLKDKVFDLERQVHEAQLFHDTSPSPIMGGSATSDAAPSVTLKKLESDLSDVSAGHDEGSHVVLSPVTPSPCAPASTIDMVDSSRSKGSSTSNGSTTLIRVDDSSTPTRRGATHMDIPKSTEHLLDSSAAKSKAEAVKASHAMSSRGLPTKSARSDAEVEVVCSHTMHHAEDLRGPHVTGRGGLVASDVTAAAVGPTAATKLTSSLPHKSTTAAPTITHTAPSSVASGSPLMLKKLSGGLFRRSKSEKQQQQQPVLLTAKYKDEDVEGRMKIVTELDFRPSQALGWSGDDVCNFLESLGLEKYVPEFVVNKVDGQKLLQLDGAQLKNIGVQNHTDRSLLKRKIREIKAAVDKEKKAIEKEAKRARKGVTKR